MKKGGFTLLELLVVIVVIGILATLVAGGATYAVRVSREKRRTTSCQTLQIAIRRYHDEYNEWPGGVEPGSGKKSHVFFGRENAKVFGMLRADSSDNPDGIHFLDETAFFTPDTDGGAMKLSEKRGNQPLVFNSRSGRWVGKDDQFLYYRVTIDFENETVFVDTKSKDGEYDLFFDEDDDEQNGEQEDD